MKPQTENFLNEAPLYPGGALLPAQLSAVQEQSPVADHVLALSGQTQPLPAQEAGERSSLWQAIADIENVDTGALPIPSAEEPKRGKAERAWGWVRRNKLVTAAGVISVGSLAASPLVETAKTVGVAAATAGVLEIGWIGGAAIALHAAGMRLPKNPLKIREYFSNLSRENVRVNSKKFNTGLIINTLSAVGQVAIPSAIIMGNLPVSSWGILAFGALDLAATYILRRKILQHVYSDPADNRLISQQ